MFFCSKDVSRSFKDPPASVSKLNSRQGSQKTILGSSSFYISTHGQPSSLISVEPHTAQSYHVAQ